MPRAGRVGSAREKTNTGRLKRCPCYGLVSGAEVHEAAPVRAPPQELPQPAVQP